MARDGAEALLAHPPLAGHVGRAGGSSARAGGGGCPTIGLAVIVTHDVAEDYAEEEVEVEVPLGTPLCPLGMVKRVPAGPHSPARQGSAVAVAVAVGLPMRSTRHTSHSASE